MASMASFRAAGRGPSPWPRRILTSFSRLVCGRIAVHLPGAQTGRRGGAGPAGGLLGGQDPAGRFLRSPPLAAAAGWPAANPRLCIGPREAGERDTELVGLGREDRADGPAGAGRPRVLRHAVRLRAAAESGPPAPGLYVPGRPADR